MNRLAAFLRRLGTPAFLLTLTAVLCLLACQPWFRGLPVLLRLPVAAACTDAYADVLAFAILAGRALRSRS